MYLLFFIRYVLYDTALIFHRVNSEFSFNPYRDASTANGVWYVGWGLTKNIIPPVLIRSVIEYRVTIKRDLQSRVRPTNFCNSPAIEDARTVRRR